MSGPEMLYMRTNYAGEFLSEDGEICPVVRKPVILDGVEVEEVTVKQNANQAWPELLDPEEYPTEGAWAKVPPYHPEVFAVLVKPFTAANGWEYKNTFDTIVQNDIRNIHWVIINQHNRALLSNEYNLNDEEELKEFLNQCQVKGLNLELDEYGQIKCPDGTTIDPDIDGAMLDIVAFVLSRNGRVIGKDRSGKWITEFVTTDEVRNQLPFDVLTSTLVDSEQGSVWDDVLSVSRLWCPDIPAEDPDPEDTEPPVEWPTDEDAKN